MPPNPPHAANGGGAAGAGAGAAVGVGYPPIRAQQSVGTHFLNQHSLQTGGQPPNGRLPRSSSLLPSLATPTSTPASATLNLSKPLPSPHGPVSNLASPPNSRRLEPTSKSEHYPHHLNLNRQHDEARPAQPDRLHPFGRLPENHRASSHYVNRWSASTNSSHGHSASLSRSPPPPPLSPTTTRRASSVDITFFLAGSPTSTTAASRTHRRSRTPSEAHEYLASLGAGGSGPANTSGYRGNHRPATSESSAPGIREHGRYPPRDDSYPSEEHYGHRKPLLGQAGDFERSPSRPRARAATNESAAMQYESGQEHHYAHHGHARSRSGKSSSDSTKYRGGKQPSQKAMLSHALQKANTAVQLDNSQDFIAARSAYTEACSLLEQVLQRTTAQDDQRKLEAIVSDSELSACQNLG